MKPSNNTCFLDPRANSGSDERLKLAKEVPLKRALVALIAILLSSPAFAFVRCYEKAEEVAVKAYRFELPIYVLIFSHLMKEGDGLQTYVVELLPMHEAEDADETFVETFYEVVFNTRRDTCELVSTDKRGSNPLK